MKFLILLAIIGVSTASRVRRGDYQPTPTTTTNMYADWHGWPTCSTDWPTFTPCPDQCSMMSTKCPCPTPPPVYQTKTETCYQTEYYPAYTTKTETCYQTQYQPSYVTKYETCYETQYQTKTETCYQTKTETCYQTKTETCTVTKTVEPQCDQGWCKKQWP